MKVQVKDRLIIFENIWDWDKIKDELIREYGIAILLSWVMKRELGFTVRVVDRYVSWDAENRSLNGLYRKVQHIHLEFTNDAAQTWFCLRFL